MNGQEERLQQQVAGPLIGGTITPPTITERLRDQKKRLEIQLEQINEALAALDSNPEVARTVDAISKLGHLV